MNSPYEARIERVSCVHVPELPLGDGISYKGRVKFVHRVEACPEG